MTETKEENQLLEDLLQIRLPESYLIALTDRARINAQGPPILGLPLSLDPDSVWGATEFARAARQDLGMSLLTLRLTGKHALCLDLENGDEKDAPVVSVNMEAPEPPKKVHDSFRQYFSDPDRWAKPDLSASSGQVEREGWFQRGVDRLEWHMNHLAFNYDHKEGGRLPRSHLWRPYRFCVQDVVLGITVLRHDRRHNRAEVDVFLTARIPEYEAESGCRALALIILSDAYKSGGSMEVRFTERVEGGRVPRELCDLAAGIGVDLAHVDEGGITPKEAKLLYLALTGLGPVVRDKVVALEQEGEISAASVCYAVHHGVWTPQELEIVLFGSRFPESILRGSAPPEAWALFHYDLFQGRTALLGGYLDRHLMAREHIVSGDKDSIVELEDDERDVKISFDPGYCAKIYHLSQDEERIPLPWLHNELRDRVLHADGHLWVLLRARDGEGLKQRFLSDLEQAVELRHTLGDVPALICVMVPGDFKRIGGGSFSRRAAKNDIGIIVCPEFVNQLDSEVYRRFEAIKVMRQ